MAANTSQNNCMRYYAVTSESELPREFLISDEVTRILHWLLFTTLCQAINIFGVCSNIINIICFVKQGFRDTVNISLTGLAVSDLGCLITLIWTDICCTPAFRDANLPFESVEFQYLTSAWIHTGFSRVTTWITAIITLERCLCITAPLKARTTVTSRGMTTTIVCVFIIHLSSLGPEYVCCRLGWKFFPKKNKTLLGVIYTEHREIIEKITFPINNTFLPGIAFVVTIVCTITLVYKLQANTRWRMTSSKTSQALKISNRNIGVAKMVTTIAVLFIACFSPLSVIFLGMSFEPRLSVDGAYFNTLTILGPVCWILESLNSSLNICIYFRMSSKYKTVCCKLFGIQYRDNSGAHTQSRIVGISLSTNSSAAKTS